MSQEFFAVLARQRTQVTPRVTASADGTARLRLDDGTTLTWWSARQAMECGQDGGARWEVTGHDLDADSTIEEVAAELERIADSLPVDEDET